MHRLPTHTCTMKLVTRSTTRSRSAYLLADGIILAPVSILCGRVCMCMLSCVAELKGCRTLCVYVKANMQLQGRANTVRSIVSDRTCTVDMLQVKSIVVFGKYEIFKRRDLFNVEFVYRHSSGYR